MNKKELKDDLQEIVNICHDGFEGFKAASRSAQREDFKSLFIRFSHQRKWFIEQIRNMALLAGIELEETGTIKGFFHRKWLAAQSGFNGKTNINILDESMFGDISAVEVYQEILSDPELPPTLHEQLSEQQRLIHDAIQQLEDLKQELISDATIGV